MNSFLNELVIINLFDVVQRYIYAMLYIILDIILNMLNITNEHINLIMSMCVEND